LGVSHPRHCCDREDLLTQAEKTPEPLPHPDTRARHPLRKVGPFNLCFGRDIDEEIFFNLSLKFASTGS
jgi:hypothetical protein